MRCKIVRTQNFMWRNIMRSTKSKKTLVLYYSIDFRTHYSCERGTKYLSVVLNY